MKRKVFKNLKDIVNYIGVEEFEHQMYNYFEVNIYDDVEVEDIMDHIGFEEILETLLSDYMVCGYTPYSLYQEWYSQFADELDGVDVVMQDNGSAYLVYNGAPYIVTTSQMLKMTESKFRRITLKSKNGRDSVTISAL